MTIVTPSGLYVLVCPESVVGVEEALDLTRTSRGYEAP